MEPIFEKDLYNTQNFLNIIANWDWAKVRFAVQRDNKIIDNCSRTTERKMRCCHQANYNDIWTFSFYAYHVRLSMLLLFRLIVEDVLFGVTGWKVGKNISTQQRSVSDDRIKDSTKESQYKHSTKESVNTTRIKDSKYRDARLNLY